MEENIESMQDDPIGIKIMLKCQVSCFGVGGSVHEEVSGGRLTPCHKMR